MHSGKAPTLGCDSTDSRRKPLSMQELYNEKILAPSAIFTSGAEI
jgi:hypothetical protein